MKKKSDYFIIFVLILLLVSSCGGGSSWFGFNQGDDQGDVTDDTDYYWTNAAVMPTGAKSFFTPTINDDTANAIIADIGNRNSLFEQYSINKTDASQEPAEQFVPDVIYASFDDGSFQEVLFDSRTGQKLRMQVENLKSAGDGYISVQLGYFYPVMEILDENGAKKWISIYEDKSTYIKIPNASVTAYCKIKYYNFSDNYCTVPPIYIQTDTRYVLIGVTDGKIYNITESVLEALDYYPTKVLQLYNIEVIGNYVYCERRGDLDFDKNYYYYKIDLRDMKAHQINDPWYYNFKRGVIFDTGDILASTYWTIYQIFSMNGIQDPYTPWLDNLSVYYDWKMPAGLMDVDLKDYRLGLRYGSSDAFTKFMDTSTANPVAAVTNALAFSDVYATDNHYYSDLSAYYGSASRQYTHTYFRDNDNALYTLTLQKYFDTPAPAPTGVGYNRLDNMACKVIGGYSDYDYVYEGCYKATPYLVLSKVFLKDHIIISREEVDKVQVDFSDGFKGVLINGSGSYDVEDYKAIRRLPVQRSFDNKNFYEVDMKTKKITKTPWNGADIFKDINAEKTIYYGNSGVAWVEKNGAGVWFIPYRENATPSKVVEQNVAGSISVDGDNIYYTERFTSTVFKTRVKNMKTGKVKTVSESEMTTGNIIELGF